MAAMVAGCDTPLYTSSGGRVITFGPSPHLQLLRIHFGQADKYEQVQQPDVEDNIYLRHAIVQVIDTHRRRGTFVADAIAYGTPPVSKRVWLMVRILQ